MQIQDIKNARGILTDSKYVIILIGNKLDLTSEIYGKREVSKEEAEEICLKYKMVWGGEISIKNLKFDELNKLFAEYVQDVYNEIGEKYLKKQEVKLINIRRKK